MRFGNEPTLPCPVDLGKQLPNSGQSAASLSTVCFDFGK
jgi:hypothetical protein